VLWICVVIPGCDRIDSSINQGLDEERLYSRHAMEYHRQHPDKRFGNPVLETWSTADYVAQSVVSAKIPGDWARFSDPLDLLKPAIQKNASGHAFCVVQRSGSIVVLSYLKQTLRLHAAVDARSQRRTDPGGRHGVFGPH
jgi:hypothetical protein